MLSAFFTAMTTIFVKIGSQGFDADLATLIRTTIIRVVLTAFIACTDQWTNPFEPPPKTWLLLGLSGLAEVWLTCAAGGT